MDDPPRLADGGHHGKEVGVTGDKDDRPDGRVLIRLQRCGCHPDVGTVVTVHGEDGLHSLPRIGFLSVEVGPVRKGLGDKQSAVPGRLRLESSRQPACAGC